MSNLTLYACAVLIWGSTWLVITFQLGVVPPAVSVAWRFGAAAAMLAGYAVYKRVSLRFDARTHAWLALQGLMLFGINYVFVYLAEQNLTSGLVAVVFSLVTLCNIVFLRILFSVPMKPRALGGSVLGIAGVMMIFWPEISGFSLSADRRLGVAYSLVATVTASFGNMAATRSHRMGLPIVSANAWAMLYGAAFVALYAAVRGEAFVFQFTFAYVASLLYLALFGSVIAFVTYLTLLGRIGADRAGYTAVAIPVVAMLLSTLFEGLEWNAWIAVGMALCLAGNLLVLGLRPRSVPKVATSAAKPVRPT